MLGYTGNYRNPERLGNAPQGSLAQRKNALIKGLAGRGRYRGGGGAKSGSMMRPDLLYNPAMRSTFGRMEQFNFGNSPEGLQQAIAATSGPPSRGPIIDEPTGMGPAAPPPSPPTMPNGQVMQFDTGGFPTIPQGQTGSVPSYITDFLNGGTTSGSVQAWLHANPWFMQQYAGG